MAARDFTLTLTGSAQRLSTLLSNAEVGGSLDESYVQLILAADPANAAAIFVGASSAVSSTLYGFALDPTQATAKDRESIGPFIDGKVRLSDIWVIGTNNEKLHVFGVPY